MKRDFLTLRDLTSGELAGLVQRAREMKHQPRGKDTSRPLMGKSVALLFEKPSTRTRVSFEVGIHQLG